MTPRSQKTFMQVVETAATDITHEAKRPRGETIVSNLLRSLWSWVRRLNNIKMSIL